MFWGFWASTGVVAVGWGSSDGKAGVTVRMKGRGRKKEAEWVREAEG